MLGVCREGEKERERWQEGGREEGRERDTEIPFLNTDTATHGLCSEFTNIYIPSITDF